MKKLVVIATTMLAVPSMADSKVIDYRLSTIKTYPDEPGCTMSVYDSVGRQLSPGLKDYYRTTGTTCTVYRDGIEIGTFLTKGENRAYFTDYNVIPGETYNYEIRASYGGYSASAVSQQTCQYVYRVELEANELMFDADGGEASKQNLQVSIYKQYSDRLDPYSFKGNGVTTDQPSWINVRFASDTQSSGWSSSQESHRLEIWTTPNENGSTREGLVTIDISYTGHSFPVRIVQAAKEVSYSSWAMANGLSGTWDAKDTNGIYNVFRYAFGVPTGNFTETPLIAITLVDGKPMIKTPAIVNASGFTFSVKASDKADGTGNTTNYLLNVSGETIVEDEVKPSRFFRLKVVQQ